MKLIHSREEVELEQWSTERLFRTAKVHEENHEYRKASIMWRAAARKELKRYREAIKTIQEMSERMKRLVEATD